MCFGGKLCPSLACLGLIGGPADQRRWWRREGGFVIATEDLSRRIVEQPAGPLAAATDPGKN